MNLAETVSPALVKYIDLLSRNSDKFGQAIKPFIEKHIKGANSIKKREAVKNDFEKDLKMIFNEFFIPYIKKNKTYLFYCLLTKSPSQKIKLYFDGISTKRKPNKITINQPSIIVQITDTITRDEWLNIWDKCLKSNRPIPKHLERVSIKSVKDLQKEYKIRREWKNIDFYLKIYKMYKDGMKNPRIASVLSEKRQIGEKISKTGASYSKDDIRKNLKKITTLIEAI